MPNGHLPPILPGSESYSYAIPIVSLPGRNGLDVNLALFYNSAVWTIDIPSGTATFNADRDFPSYGFRLGYGLIEAPPSGQTSYTLTEPDGSQRELRLISGTYLTVDSSYIDWNPSSLLLRRKDGTRWTYQQVTGATNFYRPIKVQDTNGNFISITYSTATGADKQAIATITDTVNRVVTFTYDTSTTPRLQTLTVTPAGGTTKTVAYFGWTASTLNYNFSLAVHDTLANTSPITILTSCAYPNAAGTAAGISYAFNYGDWGIVKQISRKSANGAIRSYVRYDYPAAGAGALSDHPTYQHQIVSSDGTTENSWTYGVTKAAGVTSSLAVTDPTNTTTATTNLYTSGWQTGLTSSVTLSGGAALRTVTNFYTQDNTSLSVPLNPRLTESDTTLNDSGQTTNVFLFYDSNGNVTDAYENDFGGAPLRHTHTDYLATTPYLNLHILDRPSAMYVADGSNNLKSQTAYTYDSYGTGPTNVTGAPQHDDTNYGVTFTTRGNVTKTTRYKTPSATSPSGPIDRALTYDTLGNLRTAQVDCCQQKTWAFSASTNYAFPDSVTSGGGTLTLQTSATYDLGTGRALTQTDQNNQVLHYSYDALNRPTSVTGPLSSSVNFSYDDNSAQPSATQTTATDSAKSTAQITTTDGLGRVVKQQTQDAAGQNASIIETQYDTAGRVSQVSNPHASGGTPVWTVNNYDALSRVIKVIPADGSSTANNTQFLYVGNATTVTDPAGKQRRTFTDSLGRLSEVDEPGWGDATPGTGSVTISGQELRVCSVPGPPPNNCDEWFYDSGSVSITVNGFPASAHYASFPNPSPSGIASALASQLNGTGSPVTASVNGATLTLTARANGSATNYTLSATSSSSSPGNFPFASFQAQASGTALTGGTDTATQDAPSLQHPMPTVYTYDVLDDLTLSVQGQQQRSFVYDALGRVTTATTPEAGAVTYTYSDYGLVLSRTDARNVAAGYQYDSLNRLIGVSYLLNGSAWSVMPNVCTPSGGTAANVCIAYGTTAASFNNGRITQTTDPSGSEAYQFNALGQTTAMTKTVGATAYPVSYAYDIVGSLKSITYPSGRVVQQSLDSLERVNQISSSGTNYVSGLAYNSAWQPTGFNYGNGVAASFGYNSRMQLASLAYTKSASTLLSLNYDYLNAGPGNNGQIQKIADNVDSTRTTTMVYDAWLRLKSWTNTQATITEAYDRYGNRNTQSAPVNFSATTDPTTNRLPAPYVYDAAGNMTNDGSNTLAYDGENHIISSSNGSASGTYTFDGNGRRVKKISGGTTTAYIFSGSKVVAEYDNGAAVALPSREYIYAGAQLVATLSGGATTYHHADQLSVRVSTDSTGTATRTYGHYPFGETWYETGTASKLKFTTYERDSESGNDYAMARSYVNRLARFSSVDPVAGSLGSPQALNRYAYVTNNPITFTDPSGMVLWVGGPPPPPPAAPDLSALWSFFFSGVHNRPLLMLLDFGGGGGADPVKLLRALSTCTKQVYGVLTFGFTPSQPGLNGSFRGENIFPADVGGPLQEINVTNDVSQSMQYMVDNKKGRIGTAGYTSIANPSQTYTASDDFTMSLPAYPLGLAMDTQLSELGNAIQLITHPESLPQALQRDEQVISEGIGEPRNNPPGRDLANCVYKELGLKK